MKSSPLSARAEWARSIAPATLVSSDGNAYAYLYMRILSEAYVVTGLK
jgi:hypothetical protein